jgi:hypothetical protein
MIFHSFMAAISKKGNACFYKWKIAIKQQKK